MTITISGATATSDLTITAPSAAAQFPDYFLSLINDNGLNSTPQVLSIAFSTTVTGFNLTSFGRTDVTPDGFDGTIWRLRNGTDDTVSGTLRARVIHLGVSKNFGNITRFTYETNKNQLSHF